MVVIISNRYFANERWGAVINLWTGVLECHSVAFLSFATIRYAYIRIYIYIHNLYVCTILYSYV